jgi:hypothetical protein
VVFVVIVLASGIFDTLRVKSMPTRMSATQLPPRWLRR